MVVIDRRGRCAGFIARDSERYAKKVTMDLIVLPCQSWRDVFTKPVWPPKGGLWEKLAADVLSGYVEFRSRTSMSLYGTTDE